MAGNSLGCRLYLFTRTCFAGRGAGSFFSWFGFGPDESIDTEVVVAYSQPNTYRN